MIGFIFAAGLGTRLRPLTDNCPKALIEVGGATMLERVIEKMKRAGIKRIVINVHHFADMIEGFVSSRGSFGIDIAFSDERNSLLDTGGGLWHAAPLLASDEPILIHNADILTDFDLQAMQAEFEATDADAMLLVADRHSSRKLVFSVDEHRLQGWINKSTGETLPAGADLSVGVERAFGGVHIVSPRILPLFKPWAERSEKFSIIPFYVGQASELKIIGYQPAEEYHWLDVGRPDTLEMARELTASQKL